MIFFYPERMTLTSGPNAESFQNCWLKLENGMTRRVSHRPLSHVFYVIDTFPVYSVDEDRYL